MKLLIITTVVDSAKEVELFLKKASITAYFEMDIKGFMTFARPEHRIDNWFSAGKRPVNTTGIFAFVAEEKAALLLDKLKAYAQAENILLNGFMLNIEGAI